jgi:pimeloyl-ACP methyl ester carboxylesterase
MRESAVLPTPDDASHWRVPFIDGDLICEVSGAGRPVLLIHSINAAASACEMAALARELRRGRRVYNLNLPGFGASARPDVRYDVPRFVAAIEAVCTAIRQREASEQPLDAVALSLSCEFLARSAVRQLSLYRRLVFITPTGFQKGAGRLRREDGETLERRWLTSIVESKAGSLLFRGLRRPASIRFFLKRTFGSSAIDEELFRCAVEVSRAPGAEHAPLAFITGRLFSADIRTIYEALTLPVFMGHGTRGAFADFSEAGWTADRPNWVVRPYDTGAMPNVERPTAFAADLRAFLAD